MVARGYEITNIFEALRAEREVAVGDFDNAAWSRARAAQIARYWSGDDAPTGEWIDLALTVRPQGRETDWHFRSHMTVAARVRQDDTSLSMRVPWKALGRTPRAGDRWRCNLFRCVGRDPTRGYLAWQPTHTPQPNFHVPDKFGWMVFK